VTGPVVLVSEYFGGKERHKWFAFRTHSVRSSAQS
jgi:hypothetical protein